jgi:Flp pilus assembly protein TadD
MIEPHAVRLAAAIDQASRLLASDPALAERQADAILKAVPDDPRALLIRASALRRRGDMTGARAILRPLARAHPNAAHTQYELGAVHEALGETQSALTALRRAVALNRDLAEAWRALGGLLFTLGDASGAEAAHAEESRARVRDPALRPAADALFAGQPGVAEARLRSHLLTAPHDATAMRLLADALVRLGRDMEAQPWLIRCLDIADDDTAARFELARLLFRRQDADQALRQVERLLAGDDQDAAYLNLLAACLMLSGDHGRAITVLQGLLARFPSQTSIWLNYGHALRTVGRAGEATQAYRQVIALAPTLGEAYLGIANLKLAPFTPAEGAAMASALARGDLAAVDRTSLHYALGKAREDLGDYAAAFEHYAAGAALRRATLTYCADDLTMLVARSKSMFTPSFFAAREGGGARSDAPIFIVGLPRSGSTLVEQILASHSRVEGTMELAELGVIARQLAWTRRGAEPDSYPGVLAELGPEERGSLGETFLSRTQGRRKLQRRYFIDKMPNNFLHIGLIRLILPHAKIVDVRRHPLAACVSTFKQHFAEGQGFACDLTDLGRYYRDYVDLTAHVDRVLPGRVHRVIYEDLVDDLETQVRSLLDHCGLPFEPACLRFHQTDRAVRTVSSEQVRRPIYRAALDHWRHFEPWLGPLKAALGPTLNDWRG